MHWAVRSSGFLSRGQTVVLEAVRPVRRGERLSTDMGPGRLDNSLLLDYGVLDKSSPRVWGGAACG